MLWQTDFGFWPDVLMIFFFFPPFMTDKEEHFQLFQLLCKSMSFQDQFNSFVDFSCNVIAHLFLFLGTMMCLWILWVHGMLILVDLQYFLTVANSDKTEISRTSVNCLPFRWLTGSSSWSISCVVYYAQTVQMNENFVQTTEGRRIKHHNDNQLRSKIDNQKLHKSPSFSLRKEANVMAIPLTKCSLVDFSIESS